MTFRDRITRAARAFGKPGLRAQTGRMSTSDFIFGDQIGGMTTVMLPLIDSESLLKIPAAYDAINVLTRPIKTLPLVFFKQTEEDSQVVKTRVDNVPAQRMLGNPNDRQDSLEFLEYMVRALITHYNAYAEIVPDGSRVKLIPLDPLTVTVGLVRGSDRLIYELRDEGIIRIIPDERMWHIKVGPFDSKGIVGRGPLLTSQEALQTALAVIQFGGRFFGNGAAPNVGYWKAPPGLSEAAVDRLQKSLKGKLGGMNQNSTIVAEDGLEYKEIQLPNDKAQFIETMKQSAVEVARLYGVPPHKIRSLDDATFSNIEQQAIEFVVYSLAPWLSAIEQSIKTHLIGLDNNIFAEFNINGLLRGDIAARFKAYTSGRQWGWLSVDDVRRLENMNPLPDDQGQSYLIPANMTDASADAETDS